MLTFGPRHHDGYGVCDVLLCRVERTTDIVTDSDGVSDALCSFTATAEKEIVTDVIEKLCHIGLDNDTELAMPVHKVYALSRHLR